jgi:hypothetical protein
MCVAFMPMHLVVVECKRFSKNAFRSCPNSPENFPDFFWNLFSFSFELFLFIRRLYNLFHDLQMLSIP